jgi:Raf kinase inhibitor-like YbhB/YbcL family protein
MNRRRFVRTALATVGAGSLAGCAFLDGSATNDDPDGTESPTSGTEATTGMPDLQFRSTAFEEGASIPETYTCDGDDVSPPLAIEGVGEEAETLAVIADDPDAPGETFTHWLLWNLPADVEEIPENVPTTETVEELDGARQGTNDFGEVGYSGPCPPEVGDAHTYRFRLYALSETIRAGGGAKRKETLDAIRDVRLATAEFTATYGR